jgi:hypothetical protein
MLRRASIVERQLDVDVGAASTRARPAEVRLRIPGAGCFRICSFRWHQSPCRSRRPQSPHQMAIGPGIERNGGWRAYCAGRCIVRVPRAAVENVAFVKLPNVRLNGGRGSVSVRSAPLIPVEQDPELREVVGDSHGRLPRVVTRWTCVGCQVPPERDLTPLAFSWLAIAT